jgi:Secretion system C-terminal sorting domain
LIFDSSFVLIVLLLEKKNQMLKQLLSVSTMLFFGYHTAQITITNNDLPIAGTSVIMSNAQNNPTIDIVTTGAAQTWDFSSIVYNSQDTWVHNNISSLGLFAQFSFGLLAPTKYKASYYRPSTTLPVAQITSFLPITIDSIFAFTRATVDSSATVGYGLRVQGNTVGFRSDSIEKNYDLTATFGDSWSSKVKTNFDFNPFVNARFLQRRTRSSVVDGYGTITTPFGTFNALRIKHSITERDSLFYRDSTTFPFAVNLKVPINLPPSFEYEWRTIGKKEAVLRIRTSSVAGVETVTGIEYLDSLHYNVGLNSNELISADFYPNPVANDLTVSTEIEMISVRVIDLNGKILITKNVNDNQINIDLSTCRSGVYLLEIVTNEGMIRKKILKN